MAFVFVLLLIEFSVSLCILKKLGSMFTVNVPLSVRISNFISIFVIVVAQIISWNIKIGNKNSLLNG